jgi:hypothetical protein
MKLNLSECQNQATAGREANIHKASFIERRLFYLKISFLWSPKSPDFGAKSGDFGLQYMGTQ